MPSFSDWAIAWRLASSRATVQPPGTGVDVEVSISVNSTAVTTVATSRPELREEHRVLLTQFLERCDRVKFAGYRPDADESLATLAAARGFVEDTRLKMTEARAA